jgi:acyl-CoA synthetase (AMP-forming)/AMP-acid ligase II
VSADSVHALWRENALADPDRPALIEDGMEDWLSHGALLKKVEALSARFGPSERKRLLFLSAASRIDAVAAWLAAWSRDIAVALVNPLLKREDAQGVIAAYDPDLLIGEDGWTEGLGFEPLAGGTGHRRASDHADAIHPELGLLLFTSGTTGSPKAVRLRASSVARNTQAIIRSLSLGPDDRVLAHLALNYSYGMSVVNSHLCAGGSAILTRLSLGNPLIWKRAKAFGATTVPSVPAQMNLLHQLKFDPAAFCPSLVSLTQAGGKVDRTVLETMAGKMRAHGGKLYVMYGQTEAAPRMACHELTGPEGDPTAAGRALEGGRFDIVGDGGDILPTGETGEVRYTGPNVMMGYAENRADLAKPDENQGRLDTGDIGYLGPNGMLHIVGRSKRFAKIGGIRCNLDELERAAARIASPAAVLPLADSAVIFWPEGALDNPRKEAAMLARANGFPMDGLSARLIEAIPLLESGKTNYTALRRLIEDEAQGPGN